MILFVGQVARADKGRGAFQEVDYAATFGTLAKWRPRSTTPAHRRIRRSRLRHRDAGPAGAGGPRSARRHAGRSGRRVGAAAVAASARGPGSRGLAAIGARLAAAERPLVVLGGSGWTMPPSPPSPPGSKLTPARHPSFRRKDLIDNDHPCYAGDLGLGATPG